MSTIGTRLREERLSLGKSQRNFAVIAGVSLRAQGSYERDESRPDAGYLAAIAGFTDINYIITGERALKDALKTDMTTAFKTAAAKHESACARLSGMLGQIANGQDDSAPVDSLTQIEAAVREMGAVFNTVTRMEEPTAIGGLLTKALDILHEELDSADAGTMPAPARCRFAVTAVEDALRDFAGDGPAFDTVRENAMRQAARITARYEREKTHNVVRKEKKSDARPIKRGLLKSCMVALANFEKKHGYHFRAKDRARIVDELYHIYQERRQGPTETTDAIDDRDIIRLTDYLRS